MQSLIQAHLPADIVLCSAQAADKPAIVVSETHGSTLTQPEEPGSAADVCMYKQDWLFISHQRPVKRLLQDTIHCLSSVQRRHVHSIDMQATNDSRNEPSVWEAEEEIPSDATKRDTSKSQPPPIQHSWNSDFYLELCNSACSKEISTSGPALCDTGGGLSGRTARKQSSFAGLVTDWSFYLNTHFVEAELLWKMKYTCGWV